MSKVSTEQVCPEVKVGDFFVCSWGYDQTNVDYYKVVSRTAKTVKIQPWQSAMVESESMHDMMVAGDGPRTYNDWSAMTPEMDYWDRQTAVEVKPMPPVTKRLRSWGGTASLTMNSYSNAYHWNGSPSYQTASGFGH